MPTISVLINARTKSSRLPRKLLLPFAGTTLIDLALEKMDRMDFFEHRYYGVAEPELRVRAEKFRNVEVLDRAPEAVLPGYHDHRVIYAHYARIPSEYIFWLNPCHPLLSIETVRRAYDEVQRTRFNSYTSVIPTTDWVFDANGNPVTNKDASMQSTAHSQRYFKVAHAFHVFRRDFFLQNYISWSLTPNDPALVEIPVSESYDVNDPIEFDVAETAYKRRFQ